MRLAFMGTSAFAVPALDALVRAGHDVATVLTQPDRPAGRGRKIRPSPVKQAALAHHLPLAQPESLKEIEVGEWFRALEPEVGVVIAYGNWVPRWLRDCPPHGVVNVHGSLLPRYRGAAPINWAIVNGEAGTGVCTMRIDDGLDTGPVFGCRSARIGPDETAVDVSARLAALGADLLIDTLGAVDAGESPRPQNDQDASKAPALRKEDGYVRWEWSAIEIHNRVRGFLPWPGVSVGFRETVCRILETHPLNRAAGGGAGEVVAGDSGLSVCCGDGSWLDIRRIQPANRSAMSGAEFARGVRLQSGERFLTLAPDPGIGS
jgi:methionyl-tRNA formyltransferase